MRSILASRFPAPLASISAARPASPPFVGVVRSSARTALEGFAAAHAGVAFPAVSTVERRPFLATERAARARRPVITIRLAAVATAWLAAAVSRPAAAQLAQVASSAPGTVRGVAYDSLRGAPLADAFVSIGARTTTTDARGRFRIDSVPPGRHTVTMQHAALDAVGLTGVAAQTVVGEGAIEVTLASPSFATLWRAVCAAAPSGDGGFVYGAVIDARGAPVADATVEVTWVELRKTDRRRVVQRQWRGTSRSNAAGSYGVCGVPTDAPLRIQATTDGASSGIVDLPPDHPRVLRRDLRVAPLVGAAGALRGDVAGVVTDTSGAPVVDARVVSEEADEARTDSAGRFLLRSLPTGTRQLEVLAIGMSPATAVVDVVAGQTAEVGARLRRVTKLDVVRVVASPSVRRRIERLEERRRSVAGYFRDSTAIESVATVESALAEFPGVFVERARGTSGSRFALTMRTIDGKRCVPAVWIDNAPTDADHLGALRPDEIAVMEVYPRAVSVPPEFAAADGRNRACGAIIVWTRFYLK